MPPLGPEKCREHLSESIDLEHADVSTAIRLLRHGRSGSLCDQVGKTRCHETLDEAQRLGHTGIIAAIHALLKRAKEQLQAAALRRGQAALDARKAVESMGQMNLSQ